MGEAADERPRREQIAGVAGGRPRVVIAMSERLRPTYLAEADLERLRHFAEPVWVACRGRAGHAGATGSPARHGGAGGLPRGPAGGRGPAGRSSGAPGLRLVGELEGDRFESRLDVEGLQARGLAVVDTTNGSSYPVSEWALGLILVALRNAGAHFRRLIAGEVLRRAGTTPATSTAS